MCLGGSISENGRVEVRRRIQTGANAWRNVERVVMKRKFTEGKGHGLLCRAS